MNLSVTLGKLYGVSVGPGDPELMTVKGLKALQSVPVVAFPAGLEQKVGIAEQIISSYLTPQQQRLPLNFPYVQTPDVLAEAWDIAAQTVWRSLRQGQDVAFACEGDISFYSTFTYLATTLRQKHPEIEIIYIPGVSSPFAAASVLQFPLTCQQQRLAILPALYHRAELEKTLDWAEVIVLLKFRKVYSQIWQVLSQRQLLHRAWIVEQATTQRQRIINPLPPQLSLSYFSLMMIYPTEQTGNIQSTQNFDRQAGP